MLLSRTLYRPFYQFDENDYYSSHYEKGYFDYRNNGFGDVCVNLNELLISVKKTLPCPPSPSLEQITAIFPFLNLIISPCFKPGILSPLIFLILIPFGFARNLWNICTALPDYRRAPKLVNFWKLWR